MLIFYVSIFKIIYESINKSKQNLNIFILFTQQTLLFRLNSVESSTSTIDLNILLLISVFTSLIEIIRYRYPSV